MPCLVSSWITTHPLRTTDLGQALAAVLMKLVATTYRHPIA